MRTLGVSGNMYNDIPPCIKFVYIFQTFKKQYNLGFPLSIFVVPVYNTRIHQLHSRRRLWQAAINCTMPEPRKWGSLRGRQRWERCRTLFSKQHVVVCSWYATTALKRFSLTWSDTDWLLIDWSTGDNILATAHNATHWLKFWEYFSFFPCRL